jgi:hypothetical protein
MIQGSAQFMAHIGQEFALGDAGLFGRSLGGLEVSLLLLEPQLLLFYAFLIFVADNLVKEREKGNQKEGDEKSNLEIPFKGNERWERVLKNEKKYSCRREYRAENCPDSQPKHEKDSKRINKEPQPHVPMGAAGRQQENKQSPGEGQIDPGKNGRLVKSAQDRERRPDGGPGNDQKPTQEAVALGEMGYAEAQQDRGGQKNSAQGEHPSKLFLQVQPGEAQKATQFLQDRF